MSCCGLNLPFRGNKTETDLFLAEDSDATHLSYVGTAAYEVLRKKHGWVHNKLWNVTSGVVVGEIQQTPSVNHAFYQKSNPRENHSDWFPQKMADVISKTTKWCDIMSLGPPDGIFIEKFKEALAVIHERVKDQKSAPVTIRIMFGNLPGMPTNCGAVRRALTEDLPTDGSANMNIWVGSWRLGASWNHAKIIAVDGRYLHTGGHNLWDAHYLKEHPVHDLSIEMEGRVTLDGHMFANYQWEFIKKKQDTCIGQMAENIPDYVPLIWKSRVMVSEFPKGIAEEFPPIFDYTKVLTYEKPEESVPVISLGRLGALMSTAHPMLRGDRPSDDAFVAMIHSSQKIIKATLQDIGPVCIPGTKFALPGLTWPKPYLNAIARAIWQRGVDVEIILSNPGSIPNGLSPAEACYGNGWSCVDVAAEIIKRIKKQFPKAEDDDLRQKVTENLRICFIKQLQGNAYADGTTIGLHSKHFIVDDLACYTGSQNLYVCDLAEWGVIVDHEEKTQKILSEYWDPMWKTSYTGDDCDVQEVMDSLDIERDGDDVNHISEEKRKLMEDAKPVENYCASNPDFYAASNDES